MRLKPDCLFSPFYRMLSKESLSPINPEDSMALSLSASPNSISFSNYSEKGCLNLLDTFSPGTCLSINFPVVYQQFDEVHRLRSKFTYYSKWYKGISPYSSNPLASLCHLSISDAPAFWFHKLAATS